MKSQQNAVLDALQRAQRFLDEHTGLLTAGVDLAAARKRLDDVTSSLTGHAFDQDAGNRAAKGETAKQRQLRLKLRSQLMEPIAVIARRNLRTVPEFHALQMPKPAVHGPAFLASARGMADAATIHHDTLVAHGLPTTFLDDLNAGIAKLEGSLSDREKSRTRRIGATKGLDLQEKQGRTVLSVLDALVEQGAGDNESLLRAWQSARLIRRRTGVTSATPATPAAPATPAPAAGPTAAGMQAIPATPVPATPTVNQSTPPAGGA
jgi:hypothetical protein